jgi:predicted DNA-binding antitoxin AbrB/MazE fold protein
MKNYLNIEILKNYEEGIFKFLQKIYFKRVLKRYNLENFNNINISIRKGLKFYIDNADYVNDSEKNQY